MKSRFVRGLVLVLGLALHPLTASAQGAASLSIPPAAAVQNAEDFDPEAATAAYLARVPADKKERSDAYFEGGYWLILWGLVYTLGVAWFLLGSGLSARLRDGAAKLSRFRPVRSFLYGAGYTVIATLLTLPMLVYTGYFREHKYGLSNQTLGAWFRDWVVGLGIEALLFGLLIAVLYGILRRAPRTWWLWGAGVTIAFLAVVGTFAPVYIDPLFNKYTLLPESPLRQDILSLARANGIPAEEVYLSDASRQSNRISANVRGMFGTMRVTLNDNLLNRGTPEGIEAVMGHEMGHYVLNHIYEMLPLFGLLIAAGFAFLHFTFEKVRLHFGARWGVSGISDLAGLPLLIALFAAFFFVLTPITNTIIRTNEAEADIFGLNASRQPDGFAETALQLGEYRKLAPGPIEEWIFFDHPSGQSRIRMAMKWKKEHLEELAARP